MASDELIRARELPAVIAIAWNKVLILVAVDVDFYKPQIFLPISGVR